MSEKHSKTLASTDQVIISHESQSQIHEQMSFIKSQLIQRVIRNRTVEIIKMIPYLHPSHGKGRPSTRLGVINHTQAGGFHIRFCYLVSEACLSLLCSQQNVLPGREAAFSTLPAHTVYQITHLTSTQKLWRVMRNKRNKATPIIFFI